MRGSAPTAQCLAQWAKPAHSDDGASLQLISRNDELLFFGAVIVSYEILICPPKNCQEVSAVCWKIISWRAVALQVVLTL